MEQLLIHYFIKVVDLKECGRENDDIIATLDVSKYANNLTVFFKDTLLFST